MKTLCIASDHAGFDLKEKIKSLGQKLGISWVDLGPSDSSSVDYPSFAQKMAKKILAEKSDKELLEPCGLLICGSGVGMSIVANRFKKLRAVLAQNEKVAELSRQHNASNILCLGSRLVSEAEALAIVSTWLATPFEGGRHERRVEFIDNEDHK